MSAGSGNVGNPAVRFDALGDIALLVDFISPKSVALNVAIHHVVRRLEARDFPGIEEMIPGYTTILVRYRPEMLAMEDLKTEIKSIVTTIEEVLSTPRRLIYIPVAYGGDFGCDLALVAEHTGLSQKEVIRRHARAIYYTYCIGFSPGFPYMGGLPGELHCPRKEEPRVSIPAGSVGIGGEQTGIYPQASPGGWQLIGRTPANLFDVSRDTPSAISPGDLIKFFVIDEDKYWDIKRKVASGRADGYEVHALEKTEGAFLMERIAQ